MITKPTYRLPAADDAAGFFIGILKAYRQYLTNQEFKTIRGQALAGEVEAAKVGLTRLLRKKGVFSNEERI